MVNFKNIILLITFIVSSCSYDPSVKSLEVFNNSDSAIYVYYSYKDSILLTPRLELFVKDKTGLFQKCKDSIYSPEYRINARSSSYLRERSTSTSNWIPYPDKKHVFFFFIKENIMKSYSWEEIVEKQLYDKKVKYSYEEIKDLEFLILYKPD